MAVKGYKIIEARQIYLHCDKCDTRMDESDRKFKSNAADIALGEISTLAAYWYEYTCPNCGHIYKSKTSYPHQSVKFDLNDVLVLEDSCRVD